ncbi:hypothetical protein ABS772_04400 [Methylorubrum podarium]|uniref:DUF4405 domain-containing protein n=1 Tax=Methylorubrum podarium TaxID=200476 RepID=A0ABV1QIG0_9HYPH
MSDPRLRPPLGAGLRLDRSLYRILVAAFVGVGVSGAVWALVGDILALDIDGLGHLMAQIHGGFAFPAVGITGALLAHHARAGWRARRNRASGSLAVTLALLLGLTAWGLYYGSEPWHAALVWTHIAAGAAALLLIPLHVRLGRRALTPEPSETDRSVRAPAR